MRVVLFYTLVFTCLSFTSALAQDSIPEFGTISLADMQLKDCPFDKGAGAMNLLNCENIDMYTTASGYFSNIEKRIRIKIFNQVGLKYASVDIPYYAGNNERIKNISAVTYNLDGQGNIIQTKIDKKDIFKEIVNEDQKSIRFAFPGVKPGSVIELQYLEKRDYSQRVPPFLFDDDIPTRLSFCIFTHKLSIGTNERLVTSQRVIKTCDTSLNNDITERFVMTNIPAFKFEPFMTSPRDNLQRLEFGIIRSWYLAGLSVNDKLAGINLFLLHSPYFGDQFNRDVPGIEKQIDSIKQFSYADKIKAVYNLVRNTVKWDGTYDFLANNAEDTWRTKKGSSGDINIMMLNFLKKASVQCFPLITSTTDNGRIDMQYGSIDQFNCVVVIAIDGNTSYILDATQKYQPYTVPPYSILNNYGLVIDSKQCRWLRIEDKRPLMRNVVNIKADIDSAGVMHGTASEYFYDYAKVDILTPSNSNEDNDAGKDLLQQNIVDLKIDSLKEENKDDDNRPLIRRFSFTLEMQQTGDFLFLDPLFLSSFRKNPFTDSVRHYDIDFGCNQSYSVSMYITLPHNIEASELPPNKEIRLADTSFAYGRFTAVQNNAIIMRTHLDLQNASYTADQYPFVKDIFSKMYTMFNEQIVLKRKN
ncbi:MAG TPA: DUF3857 domain-containing protein [Chitinophagaceae bacterium]|nr:DUF3857 domain-containing protein [Chitinophagaceae bacterium]